MKPKTSAWQKTFGGSPAGQNVEAALRGARPRIEAPADLREAIIRQVRVASRQQVARQEPSRSWRPWRWAAVATAAAALVLGLVAFHNAGQGNHGTEAASLRAASQVLGSEERVAGELTAAMMEPLQEELNRVDNDLKRATEHLLANLP